MLFVIVLRLNNCRRFLPRYLALAITRSFGEVRVNLMVLRGNLICRRVLGLYEGYIALRCRRCRQFRRILFLARVGLVFLLHSLRQVRKGKFLLQMNCIYALMVSTCTFMKVAHVRRSRVHVLFRRLTCRAIRIRQLTKA